MRGAPLVVAVVALATTACSVTGTSDDRESARSPTATTSARTSGVAEESTGLTGAWVLTEGQVDGEVVRAPEDPAILEFGVGAADATGTSGCNIFYAEFGPDAPFPLAEPLQATDGLCEGELEVFEDRYFDALQDADDATVDGDVLTLTGPGVRLEFTRA